MRARTSTIGLKDAWLVTSFTFSPLIQTCRPSRSDSRYCSPVLIILSPSLKTYSFFQCHSRESGNPGQAIKQLSWTPAFAGVTVGRSANAGRSSLPATASHTRHLDRGRGKGEILIVEP